MDTPKLQMQSNSIRGDYMTGIMDRVVNEVLDDVSSMLGPGATDAWIIKEGQPYYTRDGKEVMESLLFDNELAMYIHHILFQAVYNQGKNVGDGSTTLAVLYCWMYKLLRENPSAYRTVLNPTINDVRRVWENLTRSTVAALEAEAVPLDDELLKSMLFTCTQDADITAKIYLDLRGAIMAGAYIIPRKSNIATDFQATVHTRPVIKVTRQWSSVPIKSDTLENAVVLYCNGPLDIVHWQVLASMVTTGFYTGESTEDAEKNPERFKNNLNIVLLCHGLSEACRKTLKEFVQVARANDFDLSRGNGIYIYTMDEYRSMGPEEIEDIATIISGEPGIGGMVQPITFETYLHNAFAKMEPIPELESFDCDPHVLDMIKHQFVSPYNIIFDPIEGMAIDKPLNPVAQRRYDDLRREIEEEKSSIRQQSLNKRLRRSFGMFIDLEIGSVLLKDSQRKFELILDAIISSAEAARDGVLRGNSLIHLIRVLGRDNSGSNEHAELLRRAAAHTLGTLIDNVVRDRSVRYTISPEDVMNTADERGPAGFNLRNDVYWPHEKEAVDPEPVVGHYGDQEVVIHPTVVEPVGIVRAIVENSVLPIEMARTEVFHISGTSGFMGNYIP